MTVKTSPSVSYSMWLKRILDAHSAQSWNTEPTDIQEREDDELNDLWTEIDDRQRQRLWGLSSDLNSLRDRETLVESDWPPMTRKELAHGPERCLPGKGLGQTVGVSPAASALSLA